MSEEARACIEEFVNEFVKRLERESDSIEGVPDFNEIASEELEKLDAREELGLMIRTYGADTVEGWFNNWVMRYGR